MAQLLMDTVLAIAHAQKLPQKVLDVYNEKAAETRPSRDL
jgi:hypothetical protein